MTYIILSFISIVYGVLIIKKQYFPYRLLKKLRDKYIKDKNFDILNEAFSDTLIENNLVLKKIENIEALENFFVDLINFKNSFMCAINRNSIVDSSFCKNYFKVDFTHQSFKSTAYAFYRKSSIKTRDAFVIIPGSGLNQSTAIYENDKYNYHNTNGNILEILDDFGDSFVFIKPNEDILAIHNGIKKIDYNYIINYMINNGSSYSAFYITMLKALVIELKNRYDKITLIGLSQGGEVALLISMIVEDIDKVIVSSGYSIVSDKFNKASCNQLMIPNYKSRFDKYSILEKIQKSEGKYLFTYGKNDENIYQYEYNVKITENFYKGIGNVNFLYHKDGHEFPIGEIEIFLQKEHNEKNI